VRYTLNAGALSVTAIIHNPGDENLLASFGFHPAFRWPLPYGQARASHFIEFATDEPAPVRRLNAEGLLLPDGFPTPVSGRRLALTDALFQDDVIIFDALRSRSVTYGAPRGPRIRMDFPDTPFFGVWTKPSADFICLEPWHGVADGRGFRGDFSAKPGVFTVAPGAAFRIGMNITVLA
jgi:galactose mutarotase-like enzyme